ncbi:MAG: hypothetical protein NTAFB05_25780 [Nitrobacter sp.]|uniref:hypothetical protein n=1 Tax=Nitrobacter sp. TaxID=29420 RepID=UPI00387DF0A5
MQSHANDNTPATAGQFKTLAERRAFLEQQRVSQPEGEESHRGGAWPQGQRLFKAGNMVRLTGLAQWQIENAMPRLSAANDNIAVNFDHTETVQRDSVDADEIAEAIELEKEHPGEYWRPDKLEVYVRDKWRSINAEVEFARKHSSSTPAWLVDDEDEEDKMARVIDTNRLRQRLGPQTCSILDAAASDATTEEIAEIAGCGRKSVPKHVDAAIDEYLAVAA